MSPQIVTRSIEVGRALSRRLLTLEVIDRSLVVGAQAFSALIPVLIVFANVGFGSGGSFADDIIHRFELRGRGAATIREMLTSPADGTGLTALGIALVVFSSLSFTR